MWAERYFIHREEEYRVSVYDKFDRSLGITLDIQGGKLDFRSLADHRVAGSLDVVLPSRLSLLDRRLQIDYVMQPIGYPEEVWPLARVIPAVPSEDWGDVGVSLSIDVYDKNLVLNAVTTTTYTVATGDNLRTHVISILASVGETNVNIQPSTAAASDDMVWDMGTRKKIIVNEILKAMGYWSISTNGSGQWVSSPYIAPADRPIVHNYSEGPDCIYLPEFKLERDYYNVPNQLVGTMAEEGDDEPEMYIAENHNAASPFSIENRGFTLPGDPMEGIDAADIPTFQAIVERRLAELSQVAATVNLDVLWTPTQLNDALIFAHEASETNGRFTVANYSIQLVPGTLTALEVKEVIPT